MKIKYFRLIIAACLILATTLTITGCSDSDEKSSLSAVKNHSRNLESEFSFKLKGIEQSTASRFIAQNPEYENAYPMKASDQQVTRHYYFIKIKGDGDSMWKSVEGIEAMVFREAGSSEWQIVTLLGS